MLIQIQGTESWNSKDFMKYIVHKLKEKGIDYKIKAPEDYICMGRFVQHYTQKGKTKFYMKRVLDDMLQENSLTNVRSLKFILHLANINLYNTKKFEDLGRSSSTDVKWSTKQKLKQLKKTINTPE